MQRVTNSDNHDEELVKSLGDRGNSWLAIRAPHAWSSVTIIDRVRHFTLQPAKRLPLQKAMVDHWLIPQCYDKSG